MKICGIYKISSLIGRIYVGQSLDIMSRWKGYEKDLGKSQPRLHRSLKKHGVENHNFEILEECSREMLNEREIHWINFLNTFNTPHGLNLTSGGSNPIVSEESKKKMSEAQKRRAPESEESRKKRSEGQKKRSPFPQEHLNKLSEAQKRRAPISEESRKNLSAGLRRRPPPSEETRKKISDKLKGNTYGSGARTEETKKKMSEAQKRREHSPESTAKRIKTMQENKKLKENLKGKRD